MSIAASVRLALFAGLVALMWNGASTGAVAPGKNGLIAFVSERDAHAQIYTMRPDGMDQTNISNSGFEDRMPTWSSDGERLAFTRKMDENNIEIFVMNADGSEQTNVSNNPSSDVSPTWSPDGSQIAFASYRNSSFDIVVMDANGSNQTDITNSQQSEYAPSWSPDGSRIAATAIRQNSLGNGVLDIITMNADGSEELNLTNTPESDGNPGWSLDGRVVFETVSSGWEVSVVNANGTGRVPLFHYAEFWEPSVSWSPDGTKIAFDRRPTMNADPQLWTLDSDGSNPQQVPAESASEPDWQRAHAVALIWGDIQCDGFVLPDDAIVVLEHVGESSPALAGRAASCPSIGDDTSAGYQWGDINCDSRIDALDALVILRRLAGLSLPSVTTSPTCTSVGSTVDSSATPMAVSGTQ